MKAGYTERDLINLNNLKDVHYGIARLIAKNMSNQEIAKLTRRKKANIEYMVRELHHIFSTESRQQLTAKLQKLFNVTLVDLPQPTE